MRHGSRQPPRKAWPGILRPAEAREAASEGARDARREKRLRVVESAIGGGAQRGFVKREKTLPALAGRAGGRVVQQVRFGSEAQENGHDDARRSVDTRSVVLPRNFFARWRFFAEGIAIG